MAKAKTQKTADAGEGAKAAPKKSAAAKATGHAKAAAPKKSPSAAAGVPLIDTSQAAQAAAKMVANRDLLKNASTEKSESSSFKNFKQSVNKPQAQGPGGVLHNVPGPKRSNLPFGGRNQVGHNQTFGADVNRSGVPRRTGG